MAGPLIIDTHIHVYESKEAGEQQKAAYNGGWEFDDPRRGPPYSRYHGDVAEALEAMEEAGVSRAGIVNLDRSLTDRQQKITQLAEGLSETERTKAVREIDEAAAERLKQSNTWFCGLAKDHPQLAPHICIDPWVMTPEEAQAHLQDMAENHGARGIKLHSVIQRFYMADKRMWPVYQTCVELGLSVVAHSGRARGVDQYGDPQAFAGVLEAFPELKLVMAHMGNGAWRQTKEIADAYPNAIFDCCELMEWIGAPNAPTTQQLAQLIKDVGPERVMMASDFPWWSPAHCVERIMDFPILSNEEKEGILGANAVRLLGI